MTEPSRRVIEALDTDTAPGRKPPLLILWSKRDDPEDLYGDPLPIWRSWADDDRTVVRRLLQLYHYDFSEFDGGDVR
jgi:hypothetical protein